MNFKRWPLISTLSILVLFIFLISCNSGAGLNQELYTYLEQNAKTAIEQLNQNLTEYEAECSKKYSYETKITQLKQSRYVNTFDIYSELVFIGGYWVSDGEKMLNTSWVSYEKDAAGNIHYDYTNMPTESYLAEFYDIINSIKENEENLKWSVICENEAQQTLTSIDNLKTLLSCWEVSYKDWTVNKAGSNLFSISGKDLGLYLNSPSVSKWHYFSAEKVFKPADKYAENLAAVILDIQSYEQKRATYNIKSPPLEIPNYNYSWLAYFDYYHLTETVSLKVEYSRESEETQALFIQYPKLEDYWTMFEELGFNVLCTTVDEQDGYSGDYKILLYVNP